MRRRIVFLGPPGSGKGTQSTILCKEYDMVPLSTGEILRTAIAHQTPLGQIVEPILKEGLLVSDDIMNRIVEERLFKKDCLEKGYILDGYPRTLAQAQALTTILAKEGLALTHVFLFKIDDRFALERITARMRIALETRGGQTRDDDCRTISQKRLALYHSQVSGLVAYYTQMGLLLEVDVSRSIEEVTSSLRCYLHNIKERGGDRSRGGKID